MSLPLGSASFLMLLGALINTQDGINKLKLMEVATTNDDYYDNARITERPEDILRELIDIDDDGDPAIRVGIHTVTGSTKLAKAGLDELQLTRSMIGKTSDGKPYLKVVFQTLT